jgi:polar amino acid transport system permease protein
MNWHLVLTEANFERLIVGDLSRGDPGGLLLTLALSLAAIVMATILGTALALLRASRRAMLYAPAVVYIESLRNVPLLILVFWAYFIPPYFNFELSKFASVLIALTLFTAAYVAEVLRGGIRTVPRGEIEAARALGLSRAKVWIWIILPQAFHTMLPALTGRYITVVKNTSLAFLIGLSDLTDIGKQINNRLLAAPIEVYLLLLVIYFVVNQALSLVMGRLENRRLFNRIFLRL